MNGVTHLLATDLDKTFVGDREALTELLAFFEEQPYHVNLVYNTGRHFQSMQKLRDAENLPAPDIAITDVGTEIRIRNGEDFELDSEWDERMTENWQPEKIEEIAARFAGLTKQPVTGKNRSSYYVADDETAAEFGKQISDAGIPHKYIYSGSKYVDILPVDGGKGQALQYVVKKYQLQDIKLLVSGDSGNDTEMLTQGFPSVIVGNAHPELLAIPEDPTIYRASRGFAGGILEAWQYFHSK
ncbi:HAD-IIB family hydrolase [Planococcus sp. N028]|uniref:HAD-IIB family hydrolase n=1 Tax=Planococcus shixiaomingii TaxID=3058393 RepID=A0ABT8N6J6_9BACL|nr:MULTISPECIES: HAD-IIB family hydrolase [unclassified Planococcus (in: firmicutes)]MDN7243364.1 HAD-IIB family hydrolase [Planococcus sp. N028]WKA55305.1 HAD-IIB family hydrolase [Planococcus sp. N022]